MERQDSHCPWFLLCGQSNQWLPCADLNGTLIHQRVESCLESFKVGLLTASNTSTSLHTYSMLISCTELLLDDLISMGGGQDAEQL